MAHLETSKQSTLFPGLPVPNKNSKLGLFYIAQLTLRVLVFVFTSSAAIILVTSTTKFTYFGIPMKASYTQSSAFSYKFIADCIVCALTLLSVTFVIVLDRPKSNPKNYFYLFVNDLVTVLILLSGCSASTAIGLVAKFGQDKMMNWSAICSMATKLCTKVTVSIVSSYVALVILFALTVLTALKLKAEPFLERIRSESN